ncbi:uncharacterized protein LOC116735026 [Xiphophorus hellerii]|uniref:uncharacterized protein LOC116735026 n=1 Tax=Xiphophorus hellerii TaxID=8084 RepID=UPI0013B3ECEC|nr:uncharacterized protein LOC116735026 [Xiphophorus hellerii]
MTQNTTNCSKIFKNSKDDAEVYCDAPAQIKQYYSLMDDDEGPDDVFIQPHSPPPCRAVLSPTEGSRSATPADSGVSLPTEAADATRANPCSLARHHGEKQLMAARNELDEEITSTMQPSMEPMDDTLLSNDMNSTSMDYQDQKSTDDSACLVERRHDKTGKAERNNTSGDEESNEEPEDGPKPWKEEENYKQIYTDVDGNLGDTTNQEKECDRNYKGISCLERDLELSRTLSDLNKINDFTFSEPSEFTNDGTEERTKCGTKEEYVGTRSSDNILTSSEQESEEMIEQVDGNRRIASDIQQGEQLLQRLQMVQLRHDDIPNTSQEIIKVAKAEEEDKFWSEVDNGGVRGKSVTSDENEEEGASKEKERRANVTENTNNEDNDTEARTTMSTPPGMAQHKQINTKDADESLDDYSEILLSSTLPLHSPREMPGEIPFISAGHRFSAAETSMEKQIQETARARQNLQRAGGVFNLADNPDVLEIPFKTDVSLESLLTKACTVQQSQWQFSEKKMQKEISQEIQRELVLVNQGKIPGEYCKGEARQLKETKLLFEAFQQDNMEGPTRHKKLPTTAMKGPVYPSVLERTRSLEMFSLKTCLVSRAHSLRLCNSTTLEGDKSPETLRSKSPTGGSRDKTRSSPYSKHDKHLRLHRSMDSINSESSASAVEFTGKTKERQGSPILWQNPFFKLRPAMALQPEVEKDIREAKEREEELRRQRCTLYGEDRHKNEDEEKHRCTKTLKSDVKLQSRGKLERLWPPPSKTDQKKSGDLQQEAKVHRAGGQKAPLWHLWESGLINGQLSEEKE